MKEEEQNMGAKTSQEKIDQVLEYKAAGFTNKDIAKEMHMSPHTVGVIVGRMKKQSRTKITDADIVRMKELRGKGLSNSQIAKEIGCSYFTVRSYISYQPDMNRAAYGSIVAHAKGDTYVKEEKPVEKPVSKLKLARTDVTLDGKMASYKASSEGRVRIMFTTGSNADMTKDDFYELISELCEVGQWLSKNVKDDVPPFKQRMDGTYVSQ
jgi:DNA-binding CsgD family transcriptional regulator